MDILWIIWTGTTVLLVISVAFVTSILIQQKRFAGLQHDKLEQITLSEQRYTNLFHNVSDIIFIYDLDGKVSKVNETATRVLGYRVEEIEGRLISQFIDHRFLKQAAQVLSQSFESEEFGGVVSVRSRDGRQLFLEYRNSVVREEGRPVAVRGIARDVTSEIQAQRALRKSERHFKHLFQQSVIMRQNLQMLSRELLRVQEDERKRLSRELHDEVGQLLTAVNVNIEMLRRVQPGTSASIAPRLADIEELIGQIFGTIRSFSRELRPMMLDDLGLGPSVRSYANAFAERTSIVVSVEHDPEIEVLDADQKTVLYRVVQESLTNVAKHAQARHVLIDLRLDDHQACLRIRDDGRAFVVDATPTVVTGSRGLGILGMQERLHLIDGTFSIHSMEGEGTTVLATIPLRDCRVTTTTPLHDSLQG
jgi:PAS domain S-box-containing protein